ncbi:MAG: hypothetical protein ACOYL6_14775 [Bacteriovoracaceae bacterium]
MKVPFLLTKLVCAVLLMLALRPEFSFGSHDNLKSYLEVFNSYNDSTTLNNFLCTQGFDQDCDVKPVQDTNLNISGDPLLLVTHATKVWDREERAKEGIRKVTKLVMKSQNGKAVYLHANIPEKYYYHECNPDLIIDSPVGDYNLSIEATHVISVGGNFEACQATSISRTILKWKEDKFKNKNLKISIVTDASYGFGTFLNSDADYYSEIKKLYNKLGTRKISLQDMLTPMSQIQKEEFLKVNVQAFFGTVLPTDRAVFYKIGGKKIPLNSSNGPPLEIDFIESKDLKLI